MKTLFPLLLTDDPDETAGFYRSLFELEDVANVGWYVQLASPTNPSMQIAFMSDTHESVPEEFRAPPAGVVITLEFDDVDSLRARAADLDLAVHVELRDEVWGQRHFITEDPTGLLIDVVQPIPPSPEFLAEHGIA